MFVIGVVTNSLTLVHKSAPLWCLFYEYLYQNCKTEKYLLQLASYFFSSPICDIAKIIVRGMMPNTLNVTHVSVE